MRCLDLIGAWGTVDAGNTAVFAFAKTGPVTLGTSLTFDNVTQPPAKTDSAVDVTLSGVAGAVQLADGDEILLSITNGVTAETPNCALEVTYTIV